MSGRYQTPIDESGSDEGPIRPGRKRPKLRVSRRAVALSASSASSASFQPSDEGEGSANDDVDDVDASDASQQYEDDTKTGEKRGRKSAKARSKGKNTSRATIVTSPIGPDTTAYVPIDPNTITHGIDELRLDNLAIDLDESTHILNRFVTFVKNSNVRTTKPALYTANLDQAEHVLNMPFFDPDNRHFELMVNEVALYDHEPAIGDTYRAWRLAARNLKDPESEPVELFQLHTSVRENERCVQCKAGKNAMAKCNVKGGVACGNCINFRDPAECIRKFDILRERGPAFLTEDICSEGELDLMIALGEIKVDVMNRAPMSLDTHKWKRIDITKGKPANIPHSRIFIDVLSLIIWKQRYVQQLDLGVLGYNLDDVWQTIWSRNCYGKGRAPKHTNTSVYRQDPPACLVAGLPGQEPNFAASQMLKYLVSYKGIDIEKADELEDLEKYAVFTLAERNSKNKQKRAATRVLEHVMLATIGLIGSAQSLRHIANMKRREFSSVDKQEEAGGFVARGQHGPYNGKFVWVRPAVRKDRRFAKLKAATEVYKDIIVNVGTTLGQGIDFSTAIRDRACLAYIQQESLNALARGDTLIQAIFAAQVAAQYLELGVLTKSDVLQQYCVCNSAEMQATTEHMCMACGLTGPCRSMALRETPDGFLMECFGCSRQDTSAERAYIMTGENMIKTRVVDNYRKDSKIHHPPWTKDELIEALVEGYLFEGDQSVWKDAYSEQIVSIDDAKFPLDANVDIRMTYLHPYRMSIEKPFSRWLRSDGKIALHDPENVVLIKDCINRLKENNAPSVLPLLKKALQLRNAVASKPPCAGYDASVAADWTILERAFDNQRLIDKLTPQLLSSRVHNKPSRQEFERVVNMQISGVWDSTQVPKARDLRQTFLVRGELRWLDLNENEYEDMWTDDEWHTLLAVVSQIENDHSPDGFNKHGLPQLPRRGPDKVPWLWRLEACPDDVDKAFIFNEFRVRLDTMTTLCNRKHKTSESAATLFIEYVVQWFENGGKCHIFGFTMSAYCGHITNYSIGRGVHQQLKGGGSRLIKAGDPMKTGCKVLFPTNIFDDYDVTQRTVIIESWKANSLRYNYPASEHLIPLLERAVLDLADSTRWYKAVGDLQSYTPVPLPKSYKNKDAWMWSFSGEDLAASEGIYAVGDEVPEPDDPEIATYEQLVEQINSAQKDDMATDDTSETMEE